MAATGYALVLLAWAVGIGASGLAATMLPVTRRRPQPFAPAGRRLVIVGSVLELLSLGLPWLRGVGAETNEVIELRAVGGLDVFSLAFLVIAPLLLIALASSGRSTATAVDGGTVLVALAACVTLVIVGNLFIRHGEGAPGVTGWFRLAAVVSLVPVAGAVLVRSPRDGTSTVHG